MADSYCSEKLKKRVVGHGYPTYNISIQKMNSIIKSIRQRAKKLQKHIIFPEGKDERIINAAEYLVEKKICKVTLLGDAAEIHQLTDSKSLHIIDSNESLKYLDELTGRFWQRRKTKLADKKEAKKLLKNPLNYAAALVEADYADGCIAGSVAPTSDVIRAAIQCIGAKENCTIVSSCFLMALKDERALTYADCGVVPYPDAQQLADIAIESARTHALLTEEEPVVAMLSFSTKGSAKHPQIELIQKALRLAKAKAPNLKIDGELQFDAAFAREVAERKAPQSNIAGKANVFIFPNIDAGNIGYKITERLAGASATGPILQGLAKPMMDLSRGCKWQDIVNAACVAALMSKQELKI